MNSDCTGWPQEQSKDGSEADFDQVGLTAVDIQFFAQVCYSSS